jgi:hypothetical protein
MQNIFGLTVALAVALLLDTCTPFAPTALRIHPTVLRGSAHRFHGVRQHLPLAGSSSLAPSPPSRKKCLLLRAAKGDDAEFLDEDDGDTLQGSVFGAKGMNRFDSGMTPEQLKIEKELGERLMEAIIENDTDAVRELCTKGEAGVTADPDFSDDFGFSGMMLAAKVRRSCFSHIIMRMLCYVCVYVYNIFILKKR